MSTGTSTPTFGQGGSYASTSAMPLLGVTRSRTLLFLSYRDSVPRGPRNRRSASRGGADGFGLNGEAEGGASSSRGSSGDFGMDGRGSGGGGGGGKGKGKARAEPANKRRGRGAYFDASGELKEQSGDGEQDGLMDYDGASSYPPPAYSVDMGALPPKWVDTTDEVDSILNALRPKIAQLDKLHAKHILPGFTDRSDEEREIERETTEITREFRKCSRLIAGLSQDTKLLARSGKSSAREIAMAQNVQTALATRVQDASGAFRKKQSNYMQRLRGHEIRHQDIQSQSGMGGGSSLNAQSKSRDNLTAVREDMELSRQQLASSKSNQSQSQAQLLLDEEAGPTLADDDIVQRDREIDQIAKSIAELAELFQDLSALVIDQGTMLDRIDFNIEHMGQDMNAAVEELGKATQYQKRTSKGQCILFLILLIFLCITLIIVKPFWRYFVTTPPPAVVP